MTATLTIHVSDDVRDELAARAAHLGRSLPEYLSDELTTLASRASAADAIPRIRGRRARFRPVDMPEVPHLK